MSRVHGLCLSPQEKEERRSHRSVLLRLRHINKFIIFQFSAQQRTQPPPLKPYSPRRVATAARSRPDNLDSLRSRRDRDGPTTFSIKSKRKQHNYCTWVKAQIARQFTPNAKNGTHQHQDLAITWARSVSPNTSVQWNLQTTKTHKYNGTSRQCGIPKDITQPVYHDTSLARRATVQLMPRTHNR